VASSSSTRQNCAVAQTPHRAVGIIHLSATTSSCLKDENARDGGRGARIALTLAGGLKSANVQRLKANKQVTAWRGVSPSRRDGMLVLSYAHAHNCLSDLLGGALNGCILSGAVWRGGPRRVSSAAGKASRDADVYSPARRRCGMLRRTAC